ncbi:hypothetical protein OIU34_23430 [Pararhizobium sp. BT-229]|uniref:hypothetical protein n=1 Tax=Pararhizobium sp. BT-229 TaxID=2986923 RepID=UPI0021F6B1DA|nr:hypothetical protein [Pararhizobium sp. BT-229]MCV9964849.1 hypothetical protein [Pararhizobium sp. BT-229]
MEQDVPVVDLVEWEIGDLSTTVADEVIETESWGSGEQVHPFHFLVLAGKFLRPARNLTDPRPPRIDELVKPSGGWFTYGNLHALCEQAGYDSADVDFYGKAISLLKGPVTSLGKVADPSSFMRSVVSNNRDRELDRLKNSLGQLVSLGGVLYRWTHEPLIKLSILPDRVEAALYFDDGAIRRQPRTPITNSVLMPLRASKLLREIADNLSKPLHSGVDVVSLSPNSVLAEDVPLWASRRAAVLAITSAESEVGAMPTDIVGQWLALRDALQSTDVEASALADLVTPLETWLECRGHDVTESRLTLQILGPTAPASAPSPRVGF